MRCPGQRRSPPFRPAPAQLAAPAGPLQSAFAVEPTTPPKSMTAARVAAGSRRPGSTRLARPRAASRCGRLKATQNPPRDIAVGNDELPRLQMAAHTDRAMRAAGIGDSAAPLGAGLANAPTCDGVMELFRKGVHRPSRSRPRPSRKRPTLDLENLAEEVEGSGRSDLHTVRSQVRHRRVPTGAIRWPKPAISRGPHYRQHAVRGGGRPGQAVRPGPTQPPSGSRGRSGW